MPFAERILARPGADRLNQPGLWWRVPLLTGVIALGLDLFIDPISVLVGYWVWFVPGDVYYGIPLLNFVGWFVLMTLAPLAWILIAKRRAWGYGRKTAFAFIALVPLFLASVVVSLVLNGLVAAAGLH